jgi:hypothetical protein
MATVRSAILSPVPETPAAGLFPGWVLGDQGLELALYLRLAFVWGPIMAGSALMLAAVIQLVHAYK